MLRGGGDNGLENADFTKFGPMTNLVLDLHDYYNGLYGSGLHARPGGVGPLVGRHPQPEFPRLPRHRGRARPEPGICGRPDARARDPARRRGVGRADRRHGRARLPAPPALGHEPLRPLVGAVEPGPGRGSVHAAHPHEVVQLRRSGPRGGPGDARADDGDRPGRRHRADGDRLRAGRARCSRPRTAPGPACRRPSSPISGSAATRWAWPARSSPGRPPRPTS